MIDKSATDQQKNSKSFFLQTAVILVRLFGSWISVLVHTLIFAGWFIFNWNLDHLLVIVSIEAIYFCIFILMAENIETAKRERQREYERQKDMSVVKQDVAVDRKALRELQEIHQKINSIQRFIKEKK